MLPESSFGSSNSVPSPRPTFALRPTGHEWALSTPGYDRLCPNGGVVVATFRIRRAAPSVLFMYEEGGRPDRRSSCFLARSHGCRPPLWWDRVPVWQEADGPRPRRPPR